MQDYIRKAHMKKVLVSLSLVALASCTVNPYTGERQVSKAAKFGGAGALICGLIGAGESSTRARNAALGCGAIGAGIGAYMDVQEAELRQELQGTGVQVQRVGDELNLIMPGNITFNTDEYTLRPQFMPILDSVGRVLFKYKDTNLRVTGHTDATGSASYNYDLSERRARTVSNYLAEGGIEQSRLITQGMGKDQPIASNETENGRAQNRRVELKILVVSR